VAILPEQSHLCSSPEAETVAVEEGLECLPVAVAKTALFDDRHSDTPAIEVLQCPLVAHQRLVVEVAGCREDETVINGEGRLRRCWPTLVIARGNSLRSRFPQHLQRPPEADLLLASQEVDDISGGPATEAKEAPGARINHQAG